MNRYRLLLFGLCLTPLVVGAQQVADESFSFANGTPAYAMDSGPRVCIDEGHFNFHTADGRYKAYADLLRADGYRVSGYSGAFSEQALRAGCDVLVIANALAEQNQEDWRYPHPSAFDGNEIQAVMEWVRGGGALMIFADHAPIAGASRDLGAVLGLVMTDVYAINNPQGPDYFKLSDGTLHDHAIVRGRNAEEAVDQVLTFTGQPAQVTQHWQPLMSFGENAVGYIAPNQAFQTPERGVPPPNFSIAGWTHAAAREWDEGRIVFSGEAAMCSAQLAGPQRQPMGMNSPQAAQNPQFCLNMMRWLTGMLE